MTMGFAYRYKLVDGKPMECTAKEIADQEAENYTDTTLTLESRVGNLETESADMKEALDLILSGVTE